MGDTRGDQGTCHVQCSTCVAGLAGAAVGMKIVMTEVGLGGCLQQGVGWCLPTGCRV